ncbi:MAG: FAD:protein FMN transferase [bacterium]|nr:FAD:protein FMN transferase [bacterium]
MTNKENLFHKNFAAMGTRFELILIDLEPERSQRIFSMIKKEVLRIENKLSRFSPLSIVSEINSKAGTTPVSVEDELIYIVEQCRKYSEMTFGAFDITLLPLTLFWKNNDLDTPDPGQDVEDIISGYKELTGMDKVKVDPGSKTVFLEYLKMGIDLGGFGKGYALEKVREILSEDSIDTAFISFGESSILALGHHPYGDKWKVGIQNIYDTNKNTYSFDVIDGALSTSGLRIQVGNNKRRAHIIDFRSGIPVKDLKTISVKSGSPLDAEILSTALMAADPEKGKEIINNFTDCEIVEIQYSDNLKKFDITTYYN